MAADQSEEEALGQQRPAGAGEVLAALHRHLPAPDVRREQEAGPWVRVRTGACPATGWIHLEAEEAAGESSSSAGVSEGCADTRTGLSQLNLLS